MAMAFTPDGKTNALPPHVLEGAGPAQVTVSEKCADSAAVVRPVPRPSLDGPESRWYKMAAVRFLDRPLKRLHP